MLVFTLLLISFYSASSSEVTFHNVNIHVREFQIFSFTKDYLLNSGITGKNFKDFIPTKPLPTVFLEGSVPVLYENSVTDIRTVGNILLENLGMQEVRPGAFKNLEGVGRLSLSKNNLTEIKSGTFNNLTVGNLELVDNKISIIEFGAFDNMPELSNILLSNNQLRTLDVNKWFHNTPNIYRFWFSRNLVEEIPEEAFKNIDNHKKKWVKLDQNKIRKIAPRAFKGLSRIDILALDSNEIEEWDDRSLEDVVVIRGLWIRWNRIKCVTGDFGKIFKANTTLIEYNPLTEDCKERIEEWKKQNSADISY